MDWPSTSMKKVISDKLQQVISHSQILAALSTLLCYIWITFVNRHNTIPVVHLPTMDIHDISVSDLISVHFLATMISYLWFRIIKYTTNYLGDNSKSNECLWCNKLLEQLNNTININKEQSFYSKTQYYHMHTLQKH